MHISPKWHHYLPLALLICMASRIQSQKDIMLPKTKEAGINWKHKEKEFFSQTWQTPVVTNVSQPSMQVFRPAAENATGAAVIIAPGGGLYALSIENEGTAVANWLTKRGITAFVLKYRLVPTGKDGSQEVMQTAPLEVIKEAKKVLPYATTDGLNALAHVRQNAQEYGVHPYKIGFMGFSAGGAVAMGVGYTYSEENRPDFLVPVYAWTDAQPVSSPKDDSPPMFIVCASDDPLGLAKGSVALYSSQLAHQKPVSLMMYAKGGHGFGMHPQGLPVDTWIERFYEWGQAEGIFTPQMP